LRSRAEKFFRLPGLRLLRPLARRVWAVAEPAGRLTVCPQPAESKLHHDDTLTVVTANLWHDWPRHRQLAERLESFARLVEAERADVVLLQEVARTPAVRADDWLARRLGMACVYARANGHADAIGFEEGLAVISRFPLARTRLRHLGASANPFVRRLALSAVVQAPFGEFLAFSVHLGLLRRQNSQQLSHLQSWVLEIASGRAALIGGDFNAHEHSP